MIERQGKKILFNGEQVQIFGRSSFKALGHLRAGNEAGLRNWIDHCQRYGFNLLRVFGETEYWESHPMFGSPPTIKDMWDGGALQNGDRPKGLKDINRQVIDSMFRISQETGMAFEYVVDATLKHATPKDIAWGTIGHCVRQTLSFMRGMQDKYPRALVMVNFHNEWDAHSQGSWRAQYGKEMSARDLRANALRELNMQASRARRWKNGDMTEVSYISPGHGWEAEQWPEAVILVDHGGRVEIEYKADVSPDSYDLVTLHPSRGGEWWKHDGRPYLKYLDGPIPTYFSESKLWVDPVDAARAKTWYPNLNGWTTDIDKYVTFMEGAKNLGIHFVVHDEKGMQSQSGWPRAETKLEDYLKGGAPPPPPARHRYARIIDPAYREILGRPEGADPGGLEHYNALMANGMTEADMREVLIRSQEYEEKNPE